MLVHTTNIDSTCICVGDCWWWFCW
uniref:Uncharacterized protein n=1 Tax=Arundo donax TaxID=35708 RepID=A0A0A9G5D7_ARUDO